MSKLVAAWMNMMLYCTLTPSVATNKKNKMFVVMYCCLQSIIRNSWFGLGTEEDSHVALRYLLSALRQEEIKVLKHT